MFSWKNLWGEPVALWATIQATLAAANSFGWLSWAGIEGQKDMALVFAVVAALAAVHLALFTHQTLLAPLVQLVQALLASLIIYGTHVSTEQTALVVGVLTAIFAFGHRQATSPTDQPTLKLAA